MGSLVQTGMKHYAPPVARSITAYMRQREMKVDCSIYSPLSRLLLLGLLLHLAVKLVGDLSHFEVTFSLISLS